MDVRRNLLITLAFPVVYVASGALFELLGVLRVIDLITGDCSVCGSDEDWGNYPVFFFVIVTVPVTLAVLVGLVARSLRSRVRAGRPARRAGTSPDPR